MQAHIMSFENVNLGKQLVLFVPDVKQAFIVNHPWIEKTPDTFYVLKVPDMLINLH